MIREIKFRGLNVNGGWYFGSLFLNEKGQAFIDRYNWEREEVKPETVGEYTGLHDKTGKEIYEGDIVKNYWWNVDHQFIGDNWVIKFGEYDDSEIDYGSRGTGFYCENEDGEQEGFLNLPNDKGIEVIGNIYENPELLDAEL